MQKLAEICVRRPVFATMLILTLVVLGIFSYNRLVIERFPRVEFPTVVISTILPGAGPQEIETEITDKIEEAVNTISGIEELRSTSSEGVSLVFITFELERELDSAAQDVRDKLNTALPLLPKNIEQPTVQKFDPDASPIMTVSLASTRPIRETTEYADKVLRRQIESIAGVGQVQIIGGRKRQINVKLDGDKLRAYNLTVAQVSAALQQQNLEVPGGRIEQTDRTLVLRTLGRLQSAADFNSIVVANRAGYPIKISDLGYTEDGEEEELSAGRYNDTPALLLQVRRQSGTNTVEVVDAVKERLEELKKAIPAGFEIKIVRDESIFILASFHTIREHLLLGSLLAALVVLLFMQNVRATIISAIAIPTSLISTFAMMDYAGITLNGPSMLGLTLAVGIVIDDAIVVLENIFRYIEEKGYGPFEAAIEATKEIGLAVMATTLSLIVIFLPVAFMPSIAGRFFKSVALTMAFAIAVSLLVSFTLTPMMSARMLRRLKREPREASADGHEEKSSWVMRLLDRVYARLLVFSLHHRWVIVSLAILVFFGTGPLFMKVGKDFFPQDDQDEFEVTVRAAEGTSLQTTLETAQRITAEIRKLLRGFGLEQTPIVMAGGVWHLKDWEHWLDNPEIGPIAFQFGTRPLLTKESPIPEVWKHRLLTLIKGDVFLNRFSPTGFYSSAVNNNFIKELRARNDRQVPYASDPQGLMTEPYPFGPRKRPVYVEPQDLARIQAWEQQGFSEAMKTPDATLIFVSPEKANQILVDQIECMGCLSHCRFSNWKDHDDYTTGKKADPRSFCIQKSLQAIIDEGDVDHELMFSGHNAYRFGEDPFYENGFVPTVQQLVDRIMTGY